MYSAACSIVQSMTRSTHARAAVSSSSSTAGSTVTRPPWGGAALGAPPGRAETMCAAIASSWASVPVSDARVLRAWIADGREEGVEPGEDGALVGEAEGQGGV